jgi:glutamine synthetase
MSSQAMANNVIAEYVWLDGDFGVRSKTRVLFGKKSIKALKELPMWNYDGSSTKQAPGADSEVIMKPRAMYKDPFRPDGNHVLVLCDCYTPQEFAIPTNHRAIAAKVFKEKTKEEPWFGIEQEYTLFKDGTPLGWPSSQARTFGGPTTQIGFPGPQGPYYCGSGADVAFGREIVEEHMLACLMAGLNVSGTNAEVMPGQWEYQVGPCVGIDSGDQMVMSRYILERVCEKHKVLVSFDPKPILGDWNGAGCHTNFSTKSMRDKKNSLQKVIIPAVEKLAKRHEAHIKAYGSGNEKRLTGAHETASMDSFSYGIADRGASVRIPNATAQAGKGYFEDRRPASNMDPYVVTAMIFDTCILDGKYAPYFEQMFETETPVEVVADAPQVLKSKKAGKRKSKRKSKKGGKKEVVIEEEGPAEVSVEGKKAGKKKRCATS